MSVFAGERRRIGIALADRPSRASRVPRAFGRSDSTIWQGRQRKASSGLRFSRTSQCVGRPDGGMGAGSVPRVGTAAWTAARLAWRDRATASARALIAARRAAAGAPPLTDALEPQKTPLDAGVHATPAHRSSMSPRDCWPPGASQPRPGMASRHVIDDAFDPRDLSVLVAAAKMSMHALRASGSGEASAAALGRASEGILGLDAHVAMRRTIRTMTETARRAVHGVPPVVPPVPARDDRTEEGAHSGDDLDAPTLHPASARSSPTSSPARRPLRPLRPAPKSTPRTGTGAPTSTRRTSRSTTSARCCTCPTATASTSPAGSCILWMRSAGGRRSRRGGTGSSCSARGGERPRRGGGDVGGADDAQPLADPGSEGRRARRRLLLTNA